MSSGWSDVACGGRHGSARPTYAEIDLGAIARNLRRVREVAGAAASVYAVVKADAYGHGLVPVAQRLEREGVDGICVALAEEGFRLRDAHVAAPILVLNGAYGHSHGEVLRAGLIPVIYDLDQAQAFARAAPDGAVAVHLKVDTGMARLGVPDQDLATFLVSLRRYPNIRVQGLMSHLASADDDPTFTLLQCQRFAAAVKVVRAAGHWPAQLHLCNSAGIYAALPTHYDVVRVGLALYGISPSPKPDRQLTPAMRVASEILALREVGPNTPIGYGGSVRTRRQTRIATVPIGYGDGFLRASSNRGVMLVRGVRSPIVGRVSMDLTTLDVTHVPDARVGDEVVVLGRQGDGELTASDVAGAADTIAYEVFCSLSARVPRIYLQ